MRKKITYITRKEHFNAAHKLFNPNWTEEQNNEVYGLCANTNWHGHNFDLYITIKGIANSETGFIFDLKKLKAIIRKKITDKLDHKNLNMDVDFLKGVIPSIENLVVAIWEQLEPEIPDNCELHKIVLYETENNFVEYYGE